MGASRSALLQRLGRSVRAQRITLGLSQEELGHRANLDRTYISGLERGVRNPTLTAIVSLTEGLGITVSVLLEGVDDEGEARE